MTTNATAAKVTFTHKGWFGLCPVYFAGLDSECPAVHPRHALCGPLMVLSEAIFGVVFWCCRVMRPGFEAGWPLKVTGKLVPPKAIAFHDQAED
jgi:hypothetical protein